MRSGVNALCKQPRYAAGLGDVAAGNGLYPHS